MSCHIDYMQKINSKIIKIVIVLAAVLILTGVVIGLLLFPGFKISPNFVLHRDVTLYSIPSTIIFLPVSPESPCGPPITKRPVGLI